MDKQKEINDMIEVKGKIERIEHHMTLFKEGQKHSDNLHIENGKKLDNIFNLIVDNPLNADNGFIKRFNRNEKKTEAHELYFQILAGVIGASSVLIVVVKFIMKL